MKPSKIDIIKTLHCAIEYIEKLDRVVKAAKNVIIARSDNHVCDGSDLDCRECERVWTETCWSYEQMEKALRELDGGEK